jgi:ABC-type nitrate/sulfonate/bicarbonate transport system permease component
MDSPSARAPVNGMKMMLLILLAFAVVAIYAQWQHAQRAKIINARILPSPNESASPSPNEP